MRSFRTVLAVLLFRTVQAKLVLPLVVLGSWAYLYTPDPLWLGRDVELALHLQSFAAIVVGPVMAAAGAWDTARIRRESSAVYATASRGLVSELLLRIVVGTAWSAVVLIAASLAAGVRNMGAVGPVSLPVWSLLGLSLALCALEIAIGVVVGTRIAPVPAAAITFVVLYGLVYWQTRGQMWEGPRRYFPLVTEHWGPWASPSPWRIGLATGWCIALAGLAVCATALFSRRRSHLLVLLAWPTAAAVLALSLTALTLTPAASLLADANPSENRVCRGGQGFEVCLWSGDRGQMEVVFKGILSSRSALTGVMPLPTKYLESGLQNGRSPSTQEFYFPRAPRNDAQVATMLVGDTLPSAPESCASLLNVRALGDYPFHFLVGEVLQRRLGSLGESTGPIAEASEAILRQTRTSQDLWLREAFDALRNCSDAPRVP